MKRNVIVKSARSGWAYFKFVFILPAQEPMIYISKNKGENIRMYAIEFRPYLCEDIMVIETITANVQQMGRNLAFLVIQLL